MNLRVNGISVPIADKIEIEVDTAPAGERLPPTSVTVNGGTLSCYRCDLTTSGPLSVHVFGDMPADIQECALRLAACIEILTPNSPGLPIYLTAKDFANLKSLADMILAWQNERK